MHIFINLLSFKLYDKYDALGRTSQFFLNLRFITILNGI